jgi:DNA polymerase-3 subunit chi
MTEVRFYHMQQKSLEQVLPGILSKALDRQFRVVVKLGSEERLEWMNTALWTQDPAGFLPHGTAKEGFAAEQPIWLTTGDDNPNGANVLVLADGATSLAIGSFDLCCELFDGNDENAVMAARERWKNYKGSNMTRVYFQQDDAGKWVKKSES